MCFSDNRTTIILNNGYIFPKISPNLQKLIDEQDDDIKNELKKFNISEDLLFYLDRKAPHFLKHFLKNEVSLFFNPKRVEERNNKQKTQAKILGFNDFYDINFDNISFNCFLCVNPFRVDKKFVSLEYFILDFLNKEKIKQLNGDNNFYDVYEKPYGVKNYQEFVNFDLFCNIEIVNFFDLFIFSLEEKQNEWKEKNFFTMDFHYNENTYPCTIFNVEDFIHFFIEEKKLNIDKISKFSLEECFQFFEDFFNQFQQSSSPSC